MSKHASQFALSRMSLSYLQGPTTGPCTKPQESNSYLPILVFKIHFKIILLSSPIFYKLCRLFRFSC